MNPDTTSRFRVNPHLRYESVGTGRIEISAPFGIKRLRAPNALGSLLKRFSSEPCVSRERLLEGMETVVLETLLKYHFLLPENANPAVACGLCTPAQQCVGRPLSVFDMEALSVGDAVLLHAPIQTTIHNSVPVATGGQRVRAQLAQCLQHPLGNDCEGVVIDLDFETALDARDLRLYDLGDVAYRAGVDSAQDVGERLTYVCHRLVSAGARPIVLGGDHAQAFYSIRALAERYPRLGVLHIDAHPDRYSMGAPCDDELNHANVMHWVRRMKHVAVIWQVGIRDFYHQPTQHLTCQPDAKIRTLSAFEAETQGYGRLFAQMDRSLPWFITFDVDALANAESLQTATPVLGGLSYYPLLACFEQLMSNFDVVGMEFVEIGDADHGAHGAAAIAARLIGRYLFHLAGAAPHANVVYARPPR